MSQLPPMLPPVSDADAPDEVASVYADIRATRGTDFVNDFWRVLAHDPALLKRTWEDVKAVMAPGALDPLVKEMIYVAVSVTNGCTYCINTHTAAARAKGMTNEMLMELLGVVGMANETNRLVTGLQVPVDAPFLEGRAGAEPAPARARKERAEAAGPDSGGAARAARKRTPKDARPEASASPERPSEKKRLAKTPPRSAATSHDDAKPAQEAAPAARRSARRRPKSANA